MAKRIVLAGALIIGLEKHTISSTGKGNKNTYVLKQKELGTNSKIQFLVDLK